MADKWMTELAGLSGLTHFPNQGPFGLKQGSLIGNRDGYLLAIGPAKTSNQATINLMVRFQTMPSQEFDSAIRRSMENLPTFPDAQRKTIKAMQVGDDFLLWKWTYSFGKPKVEKVFALARAMVDAIKQVAPKFDGKCEICKSNSTSEIQLRNNIPGYYCSGCQERLQVEGEAAARAYDELPTNFPKGLLYGTLAALAGGIAWGGVAYWLHRVFLWGGVLIGGLISAALFKGIGKINVAGKIAVGVLTLASVLFGDALFYALETADAFKVPFSLNVLKFALQNLWELESNGDGILSLAVALGGAGLIMYQQRKPTFIPEFQRLGGRPL